MPEWSDNAQQQANEDMRNCPPTDPEPCPNEAWSPVIDFEDEPAWDGDIQLEEDPEWGSNLTVSEG